MVTLSNECNSIIILLDYGKATPIVSNIQYNKL